GARRPARPHARRGALGAGGVPPAVATGGKTLRPGGTRARASLEGPDARAEGSAEAVDVDGALRRSRARVRHRAPTRRRARRRLRAAAPATVRSPKWRTGPGGPR